MAFSESQVICLTTQAFCLTAYRSHTSFYEITLLDANGDELSIDDTNVTRIKIGRDSHLPELDITSEAPTANGSTLTNDNPSVLRLDQDDLDFPAGVYDIEYLILDDVSGQLTTHVAHGIFILHETQLSSFG